MHACMHTHNSQPQDGKGNAHEEDQEHQEPSKGARFIANPGVDLVVAGGAVDSAGSLPKPAHSGNEMETRGTGT